ncbi:MAG: hypothetical protein AAGK79_15985 [Pseudomonadota bacterium]
MHSDDDDFDAGSNDKNPTPRGGHSDNSDQQPKSEPHPEALPDLITFDSLNDLEDWLETLDYAAFWKAIAPHAVSLPSKDEVDTMIARGAIDEETMLVSLRGLAERQIAERYNLQWEDRTPFLSAQ